ncbi:DegT/DnrJ/EryC1/StrS family aminotransferase [Aestuariivirga sp.]|uniref:DegT/DnrJ/EryC1/StrS family aminotransferase n=1 Tax=Aestuariivirga sp. TaxID=2650926 RepID=UPI0039E6303E
MKEHVPFVDLDPVNDGLAEVAARVIAKGQFILGPELEAFEAAFAESCGTRQAVGVASGLDALMLSLRAWNIGAGDEVIVPAHTFFATWLAVSQVGATPVAADITHTATIDASSFAARITSRTKAVIPVHLYGQPADMEGIVQIARARNVRVLEDAAQAHGASYQGRPAGSLGDAAAFSFYPTKNLGALGDGGTVTSDDAGFVTRLRQLRNYGSPSKYVFDELGFNSRLDELQAAFLAAKLPRLAGWNGERQRIAGRYLSEISNDSVSLPVTLNDRTHVWHLFVVRVKDRGRFMAHMEAEAVAVQVHYPRLPMEEAAYRMLALDAASVPVSRDFAREAVSLPVWPRMSDAQIARVIAAVNAYAA